MRLVAIFGLLSLTAFVLVSTARADETGPLLQQVKAVGPKGEGHRAAQQAVRELMRDDASALLPILNACDDANPLAMNWLRGAFESIASRTLVAGDKLPADQLEAFVRDTSHAPRVRRLAYEWLAKVDPTAPDRIIPGMLHDPSAELRRDAVARLIASAQQATASGDAVQAIKSWRQALSGAADQDQVETIVAGLKDQEQHVDIVHHFGMLMDWKLIGPFDNKGMKGFDTAYPPEKEVDFAATYDGQLGPVEWKAYRSEEQDGVFDIGKLVFNHKGAAIYAATDFFSNEEREVEFRLATPNAWKLWLNGEFLFGNEEYHRGMQFDQYRVRGVLKPGKNTLLLKILQNEQDEDWAQAYQFKFRVTDLSGRGLHSADGRQAQRSERRPPGVR